MSDDGTGFDSDAQLPQGRAPAGFLIQCGQAIGRLVDTGSRLIEIGMNLFGVLVVVLVVWAGGTAVYDRFVDHLQDEKMITPEDALVRYMSCTYKVRGREIVKEFPGDHCPGVKSAFPDLD